MTPSLLGRWQTRIFLMWTLGAIITTIFGLLARNLMTPFIILTYVTLFGLGWDVVYTYLQRLRWDRDWPPVFFLFGAIAEAIFLWMLIRAGFLWHIFGLRSLPGVAPHQLPFVLFVAHYSAVWLATFMVMLGPLRTVVPRWRFFGGRWL